MGWTTLHRDKGMSDREFFEKEFPNGLTQNGKILKCATVRNVFYAAVQNNDDAPHMPGKVWALVVLIQRTRGDYNFGYKDMDENMGPNADDCPIEILDLLSPTDHDYALSWRASCRAKREALASKPKVGAGTRVRFATPLRFTNGDELSVFERVDSRSSTFRSVETGRQYMISGWRDRAYEVI